MAPIVIRASHNQAHPNFGNAAGRQCAAIAVLYAAYAHRSTTDPARRSQQQLDNILRAGSEHYVLSLQQRALRGGPAYPLLNLEEVHRFVHAEGVVTKVLLEVPQALALQRQVTLQVFGAAEFATLRAALHPVGSQPEIAAGRASRSAILTYNGYTVVLVWGRGVYQFFNSHACDEGGLPSTVCDTPAALCVSADFEDIMAIVWHTLAGYAVGPRVPAYQAACTVTYISFKLCSDSEVKAELRNLGRSSRGTKKARVSVEAPPCEYTLVLH